MPPEPSQTEIEEADQPDRCDECGYGKEHDPDCSLAPEGPRKPGTMQGELPPSAPRPSKVDTPEPENGHVREVILTEGVGPDAPEHALGLRWHGPPAPFLTALAQAQTTFPDELSRDGHTTYNVQDKHGNWHEVEYYFVTLKTLWKELVPKLNDQGISVLQPVSEAPSGGRCIRTILGHESGSMLEATLAIGDHDKPQELASAITYYRRYSLAAILGVSAETDDDGIAAQDAAESKPQSRMTGREGKGIKKPARFTPSTSLSSGQTERLRGMGYEEQDDGSWTATLTPAQANNQGDILSSMGDFQYGDDFVPADQLLDEEGGSDE